MPIRPENKARYPRNWPQIRAGILERAAHRCEWEGCGVKNHAIGYWQGAAFVQICMKGEHDTLDVEAADLADGFKVIEIVLTVAHLDHTPENCDAENLRAWCQRHHLRYDAKHHVETAAMTRRSRLGNAELFPLDNH